MEEWRGKVKMEVEWGLWGGFVWRGDGVLMMISNDNMNKIPI